MDIEVFYMSGAGNLFSVIDNRNFKFKKNQLSKLAKILCGINEYNSQETEGFIALNYSKKNDNAFYADFFNPDGSNDAMCGNGARSAVCLAKQLKFFPENLKSLNFEMAGEEFHAEITHSTIKVFFAAPKNFKSSITINWKDEQIIGDFVDVGSRHFVIPVESIVPDKNINEIDFTQVALPIRNNEFFAPDGVNVDIYQIQSNNIVKLRTFERGVERETGACGTGAISTALSIAYDDLLRFPILISPPSNSVLKVDICGRINAIDSIVLEGSAEVLVTRHVDVPESILA